MKKSKAWFAGLIVAMLFVGSACGLKTGEKTKSSTTKTVAVAEVSKTDLQDGEKNSATSAEADTETAAVMAKTGSTDEAEADTSDSADVLEDETADAAEPVSEDLVDGMRPEFKAAMDSYEAFYDEYVEVLKKYKDDATDLTILSDYASLMTKATEVDADFEKWDDDLNNAEYKYYIEVHSRILQKLADVG